jgi:hypothetical protein
MKITLQSTDKIVQLEIPGRAGAMPARIWEGQTETGVPVHCYVTRIAVPEGRPDRDYADFEQQLTEHAKPSPAVQGIPLRLIL